MSLKRLTRSTYLSAQILSVPTKHYIAVTIKKTGNIEHLSTCYNNFSENVINDKTQFYLGSISFASFNPYLTAKS